MKFQRESIEIYLKVRGVISGEMHEGISKGSTEEISLKNPWKSFYEKLSWRVPENNLDRFLNRAPGVIFSEGINGFM